MISECVIDSFSLKKESCIFLYGDNYIARNIYNGLKAEKYSVRALFDRRYNEPRTEADGLHLLSLTSLQENVIDENCIVILCMSSALTQESVLPALVEKGFKNILYLPMLNNRTLAEQESIRRAYLDVMSFRFSALVNIPKTCSLVESRFIEIYKNEKKTAFLCPIVYIRTATEKFLKETIFPGRPPFDTVAMKNYVDSPLADLEPFKQLFGYIMGEADYPEEYLSWQRADKKEQKILLENRRMLFKVYERNYEYNFSFFLYSPAMVEWNKGGYWNIMDGAHRSIYLMMKGKKLVPVVCSNDDYVSFLAAEENRNKEENGSNI